MGAPRHAAGWTDDRLARVKKLWSEGRSASEIARDLGGGVTRNAVIAKIHRLGLAGSVQRTEATQRLIGRTRKGAAPRATAPKAAPKRAPPVKAVAPAPQGWNGNAGRPVPPSFIPQPETKRAPLLVPFLDLGRHQCRWPVTEASPHRFCGHRATEGAYCEEHLAVSRQRVTQPSKHNGKELTRALRKYL